MNADRCFELFTTVEACGKVGLGSHGLFFGRGNFPEGHGGTGIRSVRYYLLSFIFDLCQRFAARSDETSFEVNAWPPSSQMRCPRRLLSWRTPARSRSLEGPLVVCCERTTKCCRRCSRRRNLPGQDSSPESPPIPARPFFP